jgi:hypothetical protein
VQYQQELENSCSAPLELSIALETLEAVIEVVNVAIAQ